MVGRPIDPTTSPLLDGSSVGWAYFIRLDIEADPILAWTGFGTYTFSAGHADTALAGLTFEGITHLVGEVSPVTEGQGGSEALMLSLPGVNMTDEAMRQVVYDRRRWQFRQAWVWVALLDASGAIVGAPIRLKSGRMDLMTVIEEDDGSGTVQCQIESAQSYQSEAIATRYSEQKELDATDTSQDYVWALANMTPTLGEATNLPLGGYAGPAFFGGDGNYSGYRGF
jgi:hypothetical protein